MTDEIIKDIELRMGSSVKSAKNEMTGIRAGREKISLGIIVPMLQ